MRASVSAKVTSKGQLTLPKAVRERLGVSPGDVIEFVENQGVFSIRKQIQKSPFDPYVGLLGELSGEDPDELVRELRGHK